MDHKRLFTEAARAAARAARQRNAKLRAEAKENGEIEVFAVRLATGYSWQVRKFGGLVILDGDQWFESATAARAAGRSALDRRGSGNDPAQ